MTVILQEIYNIHMLKRYESFLKEFDKKLKAYFDNPNIMCKKGCSYCCKGADFPFSRLEAEYLMSGFQGLEKPVKDRVRQNISKIKQENPNAYNCPFLIDDMCCLYERRGLVCRTYGLCYLSDGIAKLPDCANFGLNYSKVFINGTVTDPIQENLRTDKIFQSDLAKKFDLEHGEIRRLIDWF